MGVSYMPMLSVYAARHSYRTDSLLWNSFWVLAPADPIFDYRPCIVRGRRVANRVHFLLGDRLGLGLWIIHRIESAVFALRDQATRGEIREPASSRPPRASRGYDTGNLRSAGRLYARGGPSPDHVVQRVGVYRVPGCDLSGARWRLSICVSQAPAVIACRTVVFESPYPDEHG